MSSSITHEASVEIATPASTPRVIGYGVVTWLIPFLVAVPLMTPEGSPVVDPIVFKQIMLLVGAGVGTWLLVRVMRHSHHDAVSRAIWVGITWLVINCGLDIAILLPLSGMSLATWGTTIGLGYLTIPVIAYGMGVVTRDASRESATVGLNG